MMQVLFLWSIIFTFFPICKQDIPILK
ncbi:hypothetical protein D1864_16810 [Oceanobacillus picturae]|nr:hypothetical protein D1864_16810 [Oceanobacillus picturae]